MEQLMGIWQTFILGLGRSAAFVAFAPVLGGPMVPRLIKVGAAVALTLFCLRLPYDPEIWRQVSLPWFVLLLAKELAVGFLLGFSIRVLLAAMQAAGELIGFQMMFTAGSTFLAMTQEQSSVTANFIYIISVMIFLAIDGHHWLIRGLDLSFATLPVHAMPLGWGGMEMWLQAFGRFFEISLRLALPLLTALFLTNMVMGVISRTMPQINVFVVGMPIQIMAGFLVMGLMLLALAGAEHGIFDAWARELRILILGMRPA
jgi:flagellar biosynthetic protein FliR